MIKDYLEYLQKVLGIQQIQLPVEELSLFVENGKPWIEKQIKPYRLLILNCMSRPEQSLMNPVVNELFFKMVAAMKLGEIPYACLDVMSLNREKMISELGVLASADFVLCMSHEPDMRGQIQMKSAMNWMETFSAEFLLKNPQAKKIVWDDLQLLMQKMNEVS